MSVFGDDVTPPRCTQSKIMCIWSLAATNSRWISVSRACHGPTNLRVRIEIENDRHHMMHPNVASQPMEAWAQCRPQLPSTRRWTSRARLCASVCVYQQIDCEFQWDTLRLLYLWWLLAACIPFMRLQRIVYSHYTDTAGSRDTGHIAHTPLYRIQLHGIPTCNLRRMDNVRVLLQY